MPGRGSSLGRELVNCLGAVTAPIAAAIVLRQRHDLVAFAVALAAIALALRGLQTRVGLGSLGLAAAIAARVGVDTAALAVAIAGLSAAALAVFGVEDVLRTLPARVHAVIGAALLLAAVIVLGRIVISGGFGAVLPGSADVLEPGDVVALSVAMSFEAAATHRRSSAPGQIVHFCSAAVQLPLVFAATRRPRPHLITLAASVAVGALVVAPPRAIELGGLVVLAVAGGRQLWRCAHRSSPIDLATIAFVSIAFLTKPPSSASLVAMTAGLLLTVRASAQTNRIRISRHD